MSLPRTPKSKDKRESPCMHGMHYSKVSNPNSRDGAQKQRQITIRELPQAASNGARMCGMSHGEAKSNRWQFGLRELLLAVVIFGVLAMLYPVERRRIYPIYNPAKRWGEVELRRMSPEYEQRFRDEFKKN